MDKALRTCLLAAWWVMAASAAAYAGDAGAVIGWRGDGTGKYPAAHPPTTWGRVSAAAEGLRYRTGEPDGPQPPAPMPDGVIREWLVLGPVPMPADAGVEQDTLPDEAALVPAEGQKTADRVWKKVTLDTAYIDFAAMMGKSPNSVAYAFTRIYSETGGAFQMNLTYVGGARISVNGKAGQSIGGGRFKVNLAKGWNRILLKISPGENDWYVVPVLHACAPAQYTEAGIAWKTALGDAYPAFYGGGMGVASPVIVGDNLYLLMEPCDLVCLNKADGKMRWLRRCSYLEAASDEERKRPAFKDAEAVAAKIDAVNAALVSGTASPKQLLEKVELEKELRKAMKRVDPEKYAIETPPDVGFSGFTPSTDGRFIYVWSASGVSACFGLSGDLKWIRVDRRPAVEHGFSSSPLLADGKLIVFMRDLMAFDAATGAPAWQDPLVKYEGLNPGGFFHGSPVAVTIGGVRAAALGSGTIIRAADGKILHKNPEAGNQSIASPVTEGRTLVTSGAGMLLFIQQLPEKCTDPLQVSTRKVVLDCSAFPKHYLPWHIASPLLHDGLAYLVNNAGVLTVIDVQSGATVYQKMLDLDTFQAHNEGAARGVGVSPALAGGRIYVFGNSGAALVLDPGRVYRQIARNKIESVVQPGHWSERQERFVGNPVFDGNRIYLRGEEYLYCIGEKP